MSKGTAIRSVEHFNHIATKAGSFIKQIQN